MSYSVQHEQQAAHEELSHLDSLDKSLLSVWSIMGCAVGCFHGLSFHTASEAAAREPSCVKKLNCTALQSHRKSWVKRILFSEMEMGV